MKIAEALLLRNEYKKQISSLKDRIESNIRIPEGEEAFENADDLIKKMFEVEDELSNLIIQINHKNLTTKTSEGNLLADLIAKRDTIKNKKQHLDNVMYNVNRKGYSSRHEEGNVVVDVKQIQKDIGNLAKEYRLVNAELQGANWTIDL